jgi:hypothetical protein
MKNIILSDEQTSEYHGIKYRGIQSKLYFVDDKTKLDDIKIQIDKDLDEEEDNLLKSESKNTVVRRLISPEISKFMPFGEGKMYRLLTTTPEPVGGKGYAVFGYGAVVIK